MVALKHYLEGFYNLFSSRCPHRGPDLEIETQITFEKILMDSPLPHTTSIVEALKFDRFENIPKSRFNVKDSLACPGLVLGLISIDEV